jgi:type IV secretion system protein TrbL
MKTLRPWLLLLALLALCSSSFAADADISTVMSQYRDLSQNFGTIIAAAAKKLAVLLFTIDLAWMVSSKLLKGADVPEILTTVAMRSMWLGFLFFLMNAEIPFSIIKGFMALGEQGSGVTVFNPGAIFWQGIDLVNIMTTRFAEGANIAGIPVPGAIAAMVNPLVAMTLGLSIVVIVLAYLFMTAQYIAIILQMYFYLACYPIVLAMGATKFGNDMSLKAVSAAIVIGVRFLAIYFVMAIASSMSKSMGDQLANLSVTNLSPMWAVFGMAGLLAFLALKVPQMASDLLGGTASLSGGDAVAAGAAAGGAVAAAGGALGAATGSLSGALQAGGAAINQAQAAGATGFAGTMAGAAGALARGVGGAAADGIKSLGSQSTGSGLASRINETTAGMQEAQAASGGGTVPAPPVSPAGGDGGGSSQPPAPTDNATATQSVTPSAATTSGASKQPAAPASTTGSSGQSSPVQTTSSGATVSSASGATTAPSGGSAANYNQQPPAPPIDTGNLVQELKSADSVQATSVNLQAGTHD